LIFGAGGSIIGIIAGAICGQTTEAGFVDGACKGAVTGAIAALELLNNAEPLSKVILQVSPMASALKHFAPVLLVTHWSN